MLVAVLGAVGAAAAAAGPAPNDTFSVPGTESQRASDLLKQKFPTVTNGNGAVAQIVFVAPRGQTVTAAANAATIDKVVSEAAAGPQVVGAVNPFQGHTVSKDGSTAYVNVTYKVAANSLTHATKTALQDAAQQGRDAGLTVEIGGTALNASASNGSGTAVGLAIAAVVLLITFSSLAAAGMPLLTAIFGVVVSVASIRALGSTLGLSSTTSTLALMLGLAVGIDYAMFIVSRYQQERTQGHAPQDAAGQAVGAAGSSVVFAGLTVVIGLAGLSLVGIPLLTKMGLAAAGAVVVAVLIALTLVPALLGFFPGAALPRATRRASRAGHRAGRIGRHLADGKPNRGSRWARWVVRHRAPVLLLTVVALGVIALPAMDLRLGSPGNDTLPASTTQRRAYDTITAAFGPGSNGPLTIVVDVTGTPNPTAAAEAVAAKVGATPDIVSVSRPRLDSTHDTAVFSAIPATAPDARATTDLVHTLRAERPAVASATGATYMVSGMTAINIDIAQKVQGALIPYLAVVVGLAFLLLMVLFRSVLVPLKAALGFALSVLAALGAVVAVFQWGWLGWVLGVHATGPIQSLMPIFMVGIVFGLAMDYEVFLVSRIREAHVNAEPAQPAIVSGFRHSARVVTAAAVIMTSVFGGFVGSGQSMIKMIGFGLATAVLFDAFVVRMTIVPAVLALLDERAWWLPRWLHRVLPHVHVEGEAADRRPPAIPVGDTADHEPVSVG
jgi:RND superfamily putative drug exporter